MKLKTEQYEIKDIETVANLLKEGKVVAFPTDTVYGLACIYDNEEALKALKRAKFDQKKNRYRLWFFFSPNGGNRNYERRSKRFSGRIYAGAFTMVLKKNENLPDI